MFKTKNILSNSESKISFFLWKFAIFESKVNEVLENQRNLRNIEQKIDRLENWNWTPDFSSCKIINNFNFSNINNINKSINTDDGNLLDKEFFCKYCHIIRKFRNTLAHQGKDDFECLKKLYKKLSSEIINLIAISNKLPILYDFIDEIGISSEIFDIYGDSFELKPDNEGEVKMFFSEFIDQQNFKDSDFNYNDFLYRNNFKTDLIDNEFAPGVGVINLNVLIQDNSIIDFFITIIEDILKVIQNSDLI